MDLHPDRLALLRAIAADPDDDTPRLVYADWLDEHGTTDADRARAEYIRLSCKAAKARRTAAEGKWLDAHWRRLVPGFAGWLDSPAVARPDFSRDRGVVTVYGWSTAVRSEPPFEPADWVTVELAFGRGLAGRVRYEDPEVFAACGPRLAADEPLARHAVELFSPAVRRQPDGGYRFGVTPDLCLGRAVWDRVVGHATVADDQENPVKWFDEPPGDGARKAVIARAHAAVAAALTAEARHGAGWPEDFPTLGG